jgi:opacity protein-like surface antigen
MTIPFFKANGKRCLFDALWTVAVLNSLISARGQEAESPNATQTNSSAAISTNSSAMRLGPFDVLTSLRGNVTYDDNIYIQHVNKTSDLIWTATPGVVLAAGDYREKQESLFTLAYSPGFILFTDHGHNNAIDQDVQLALEWHSGSWILGLKQGYQQISGAIIEIGNRVTATTYNTELNLEYDLSPKTSFELDGRQSINNYAGPYFDYTQRTVAGWVDYEITPKIKLGAGITGGFLDILQNPDQTYQQALLRAGYLLTTKVTAQASAGVELREFQGTAKDRANGTFSLAGVYSPWEGTQLQLDTYRRDQSSLVLAGQNYTVTGFSGGARQAILEKYTLSLLGGYNSSDYYSTEPGVIANRHDDYFFIQFGVDYAVSDRLTVGVLYEYRDNNSSVAASTFNDQQVGVTATCHF